MHWGRGGLTLPMPVPSPEKSGGGIKKYSNLWLTTYYICSIIKLDRLWIEMANCWNCKCIMVYSTELPNYKTSTTKAFNIWINKYMRWPLQIISHKTTSRGLSYKKNTSAMNVTIKSLVSDPSKNVHFGLHIKPKPTERENCLWQKMTRIKILICLYIIWEKKRLMLSLYKAFTLQNNLATNLGYGIKEIMANVYERPAQKTH